MNLKTQLCKQNVSQNQKEREQHQEWESHAKEMPQRLFTDVMSPFIVESMSYFQFCIVFEDQYTNFVFLGFFVCVKCATEPLTILEKFIPCVGKNKTLRQENQTKISLREYQNVLHGCKYSTKEDQTERSQPLC